MNGKTPRENRWDPHTVDGQDRTPVPAGRHRFGDVRHCYDEAHRGLELTL